MVVGAIITLLILVNALYVAAEFSAVSVRRSRIKQRAEHGSRLARMLLPVVEDPHRLDRYIAACQIGITISSLVLGAYGQAALAPALQPLFVGWGGMRQLAAESASATVVLFGLTALQMVLGELVPKSLALQFPTGLALYTVGPMQWSLRAFAGFIHILNGSGIAILRLLGVSEAGHRHIHSPQEIDYLIAESRRGGLLGPDEYKRLHQALRLAVRRVDEIMVPRTRMRALDAQVEVADALRTAIGTPFTRFPVYREQVDDVIGLVHILDLARASGESHRQPVGKLARPITVVPEGMVAERVLGRLRAERQHMALVVDEFGGTAGLVTIGDLLDEIFGDVADEFKTEEAIPQRLPDGRVRIPGSLRLHDVEPWVGACWEGEAYTVGGLVAERLGRIPANGDRLVIDGVAVEVERTEGHVVQWLVATPRPAPMKAGPDE